MSKQIDLNGRRYWILSEPHGAAWKSIVVELVDGQQETIDPVGIEAMAETRGAADDAAEHKLRRMVQAARVQPPRKRR
jgi:hypothetical protein